MRTQPSTAKIPWGRVAGMAMGMTLGGPAFIAVGALAGQALQHLLPIIFDEKGLFTLGADIAKGVLSNLAYDASKATAFRLGASLAAQARQEIGDTLQVALRDALIEGIYDIGGPNCFPQEWRAVRGTPPDVQFPLTSKGNRLWGHQDPLAQQTCSFLHKCVIDALAGRMISSTILEGDLKDARTLLSADTISDVNVAFVQDVLGATISEFGALFAELPEFKSHLQLHLFGRVIFHLNRKLETKPHIWRVFNRCLLEELRVAVNTLQGSNSDISSQLQRLLTYNQEIIDQLSKSTTTQIEAIASGDQQIDERIDNLLQRMSLNQRELIDLILDVDRKLANIHSAISREAAYIVRDLSSPYQGLRSFTIDESRAYAGRQAEIEQAVLKLTQDPHQQCLLFVVGASGSGKSSFAQAGVIPALVAHFQQRRRHALVARPFRPSRNPMKALRSVLAQLQDIATNLNDGIGQEDTTVRILLIDQFEEVFQSNDLVESTELLTWLSAMPPFDESHLIVILTLRSDYLGELHRIEPLWDALTHADARIDLRAMSVASLHLAISQPLEARCEHDVRYCGKRMQLALLERLAADASVDAALLPFLQVTLDAIWKRGELRVENYTSLTSAITERADRVYMYRDYDSSRPANPRSQSEREAILRICLNLVDPSPDDDPRRDVRIDRERKWFAAEYREIIEDLVHARLLVASDEGGQSVIGIVHDSLIVNWDRLRELVEAEREYLRRRARFERQVADWIRSGYADSFLLRGGYLEDARQLSISSDISLKRPEARSLYEKSIAQELKEIAELADQNAKLIRSINGARSRELAGIAQAEISNDTERAILLAVEAVNISPTLEALDALRKTLSWPSPTQITRHGAPTTCADISKDGRLVVTADEGGTVRIWDATDGRELALLRKQEKRIRICRFVEAKSLLLTVEEDSNFVTVWDVKTGNEVLQLSGHVDEILSLDCLPNGELIVTSSRDQTARVWDLLTGESVSIFAKHVGEVRPVLFSQTGQLVMTKSADLTVRIWQSADAQEIARFQIRDPNVIARMDPSGLQLAISRENTVSLYSIVTASVVGDLIGHSKPVTDIAWSRDGRTLASTSTDGRAILWDVSTRSKLIELSGHEGSSYHVEFTPDEKYLLTGGVDHTTRLWDAKSGELLKTLKSWARFNDRVMARAVVGDELVGVSVGGSMTACAWDTKQHADDEPLLIEGPFKIAELSPNGDRIVTIHDNGQLLQIWDSSNAKEIYSASSNFEILPFVAFSARDSLFAYIEETLSSWSADMQRVVVRDTYSGQEVSTLVGERSHVTSIAFSPIFDGLLTAGWGGMIHLWDLQHESLLLEIKAHESLVQWVRFSLDGTWILSAGYDDALCVWSASSGQKLFQIPIRSRGRQLESGWILPYHFDISPDGRSVAVPHDDYTVGVWDLVTRENTLTLVGHVGNVNTVLFSPGGDYIATSADDYTARVWDARDGHEIGVIGPHKEKYVHMELANQGKTIVTYSADGVRVWEASTLAEMGRIASPVRAGITPGHISPYGERVLVFRDDMLEIHTTSAEDLIHKALGRVTRNLSEEERRIFMKLRD